ncbi:MAG: hypothetical protein LBF19_04610 [Prevotellaceae bacterium]|jgi:hypothetical protein|nr:hypothetical protein [Prevotellaceae bacterium]
MKQITLFSLLWSLTVCSLAFISCDSPRADELSFLKEYDRQYPSEVHLWDKQSLVDRLKQLVGDDAVWASLPSLRGTEMPVTVNGEVVVIAACEQHNCNRSNLLIVVDLAANSVAVGIRKEGAVTVYNESDTVPDALQEWLAQDNNIE